jgi:SLBB domain
MNTLTHSVRMSAFAAGAYALLIAATILVPTTVAGQEPGAIDARRPGVTRAQLQQALVDAEALSNSDAYSAAFRDDKRQEAALIRERLLEGDFFVGDEINLTMLSVVGDSGIGGLRAVGPGRILSLPGLPDIPMRGVLRSEVEPYLTEQIGRYIRDPQLKARPTIRLTILGSVGKPGFIQLDSDLLLSDALNQAGGIVNGSVMDRSKITRGKDEIVDGAAFEKAIADGVTLDELNLRAGDVIDVGTKSTKNWFNTLRTIGFIPALIISTYGLGKLLKIF